MPHSPTGNLVPPEDDPTDDLGVLHVLSHNAHLVLDEFEVCQKCCKNHTQLQSERSLAMNAIKYVTESLEFSKNRLMLIPELDSFAAWMCSRYSGAARRVIRTALNLYHKELTEKIGSLPENPYGPEVVERGLVSGCLLELWNDGTD